MSNLQALVRKSQARNLQALRLQLKRLEDSGDTESLRMFADVLQQMSFSARSAAVGCVVNRVAQGVSVIDGFGLEMPNIYGTSKG